MRLKTVFQKMESDIDDCLRVDELRQEELVRGGAEIKEAYDSLDPEKRRLFEEQQARRRDFRERLPLLEQERMAQFNRDRGRP